MFVNRLSSLLLLLPFVVADVHKLKLKKLAPTLADSTLETAYLSEKYGGGQVPIMGAGGIGRNVRAARPHEDDGLYWTQDELKGGHNVPLSSMSSPQRSWS